VSGEGSDGIGHYFQIAVGDPPGSGYRSASVGSVLILCAFAALGAIILLLRLFGAFGAATPSVRAALAAWLGCQAGGSLVRAQR
jgi:ABC-type transporter Mla subunit MlaD